jgi:hypothetical protein
VPGFERVLLSESPRFRLSDFFVQQSFTFPLLFPSTRVMNRHARNKRKKGYHRMTTVETAATDKAAAVAARGAHVAPEKAPAKKAASHKNGAPKAKKTAMGAKHGAKAKSAAPKKTTKASAKASKKAVEPTTARKSAAPRAESKGAKILDMIARAKGATLAEIMKATDWQAHSVRGFISTAAKKHGVAIESAKNDAGERTYRIGK